MAQFNPYQRSPIPTELIHEILNPCLYDLGHWEDAATLVACCKVSTQFRAIAMPLLYSKVTLCHYRPSSHHRSWYSDHAFHCSEFHTLLTSAPVIAQYVTSLSVDFSDTNGELEEGWRQWDELPQIGKLLVSARKLEVRNSKPKWHSLTRSSTNAIDALKEILWPQLSEIILNRIETGSSGQEFLHNLLHSSSSHPIYITLRNIKFHSPEILNWTPSIDYSKMTLPSSLPLVHTLELGSESSLTCMLWLLRSPETPFNLSTLHTLVVSLTYENELSLLLEVISATQTTLKHLTLDWHTTYTSGAGFASTSPLDRILTLKLIHNGQQAGRFYYDETEWFHPTRTLLSHVPDENSLQNLTLVVKDVIDQNDIDVDMWSLIVSELSNPRFAKLKKLGVCVSFSKKFRETTVIDPASITMDLSDTFSEFRDRGILQLQV